MGILAREVGRTAIYRYIYGLQIMRLMIEVNLYGETRGGKAHPPIVATIIPHPLPPITKNTKLRLCHKSSKRTIFCPILH
jgi:hypothetical protein